MLKRDGDRCRSYGLRLVVDPPEAVPDRSTVERVIRRSAGRNTLLNLPVDEWPAHPCLARRRRRVAA
ncbi:MAG TPA: hypothetical protein VE760_06500 [Acidimicrobiales bacterium]|jgi:hypothetical protein|nr:hypothetical protein [Acidimicrobiales bacterium]